MGTIRYTLRLDEIDGVDTASLLKSFFEKHDDVFESYLVAYEKADKTGKLHYQGWVMTRYKKTKWCELVTKHFPQEKYQKSCAEVKKEEYLIYVCKGGDIRYKKGVSDDQIVKWKELSYDKNKKDDNKKTGFDRALEYVRRHYNADDARDEGAMQHILDIIIDYYTDECKCHPNHFQLKCMTESIYRQLLSSRPDAYKKFKSIMKKEVLGTMITYPTL